MNERRLEAGPLLALVGAVLLLVSLFLSWYRPDLTAWEIFEVLDLVLAAIAIATALAALSALGVSIPAVPQRWLGPLAVVAFVLVVATLLNDPPAVAGAKVDTGLWLALAGVCCMAAGALLAVARISVRFDVQDRRTRVAAVDARAGEQPDQTEPTAKL